MTTNDHEEVGRWIVPSMFPYTLLEVARERGHEPAQLLIRAGIVAGSVDELLDRGIRLEDHVRLFETVADALADPRLGLEIGSRLPPTALGSLGHALLASATARDALSLLSRYWPLVSRALALRVRVEGEVTSIVLRSHAAMTPAQRRIGAEVALVSLRRGLSVLVAEAALDSEAWFALPEPHYGDDVRARLGAVRFDMPESALRIPSRYLDVALPLANPLGLRAALADCERDLAERGLTSAGALARVEAVLTAGPNGYPDLDEVARRLRTNPRTLRRHLALEGSGYAALLDEARRRDALRLLQRDELALGEVATRLGFENQANFTRAFKRWQGETPSQYRRARRADLT